MKKVVLIGDSIRMGYQKHVTQALQDVADVWGPVENGGHTPNLLVYMHLWVLHRQPDLVHINSGLHDLKTLFYGSRKPIVPVHHYQENVRTLIETIQQETKARVIWALTTPVQDEPHNTAHAKWNDFCRYNEYVLQYNEAAAEVCRALNTPVNDLYAVAQSAGLSRIQTDDGVHYNEVGSGILGDAVAQKIREHLV